MPELLLEVGCEEIPARALIDVLPELKLQAQKSFEQAHLSPSAIDVFATPRRLAVCVQSLAEGQPDRKERVVGPPVMAGPSGAKAAEGFARKLGLDVSALGQAETEKGPRYVADLEIKGQATLALLPELLSSLLGGLPWPKSMRWGRGEILFSRPIRWILCLYDGKPVAFSFAGVAASNLSYGHRFLAPGGFAVRATADWRKGLSERHVIVDPEERRRAIVTELERIERETGFSVRPDEGLLDEVTYLVELPVAVSGSFDETFLRVPEPVITSAMRSHQRYFAMVHPDGRLANRFVTIAGTIVRDKRLVAAGNERVLRARLKDAAFFYDEDRKVPLEDRVPRLQGIIWIKGLGTMLDKTERLVALSKQVAEEAKLDGNELAQVQRAARLAKADLLTHLVGEFPDLQGLVGAAYASDSGEDPAVSAAIAEHYAPRGAKDAPAAGRVGAAIAIADRIDSLVGCFGAGIVPTGSADPYGLRRAALGVLQTLFAHNWDLSLTRLIALGQSEGTAQRDAPKKILGQTPMAFFEGRLRVLLHENLGHPVDVVDAVLAASSDRPVDAKLRAEALGKLRTQPAFEPLGIAIKRVSNILRSDAEQKSEQKKETEVSTTDWPALLSTTAEQALLEASRAMVRRVKPLVAAQQYEQALLALAELKVPVDTFFEKVFVMDEDLKVRRARLALLAEVHQLFVPIADFGRLSVGAA